MELFLDPSQPLVQEIHVKALSPAMSSPHQESKKTLEYSEHKSTSRHCLFSIVCFFFFLFYLSLTPLTSWLFSRAIVLGSVLSQTFWIMRCGLASGAE